MSKDSEQAIHIVTREAIRDETTGLTQYRGSVQIRQGSLLIEAEEVTLLEAGRPLPVLLQTPVDMLFSELPDALTADGSATDIRIIATGEPARVQQQFEENAPPVHATAELIGYLRQRGLIRLREQARVYQGETVMHAHTLDYLIDRQLIQARSGSDGSGRVYTRIPPERLQPQQDASSAAAEGTGAAQ